MHTVLHLILSLILAWNISRAIPAFLPRRFESKWTEIPETVLLYLICILPIIPEFTASYLISLAFFICYILVFYKDRTEKLSAFAVIFFSIISSWSFLSSICIGYFIGKNVPLWLSGSITILLVALAFIYFGIFRAYFRKVSDSMLLDSFTKRMWNYSVIVALTPSVLILALVSNPPQNPLMSQCMSFFAIIASTVIFPLLYQMGRSAKLSEENSKLMAAAAYYQDIEAQQEDIRKMKHDLMNHFTVIATYLDLGENDKAVSYLKEIGTEFSELTRQYTSSTMINAILNSKRQKAKGRGIELSVTSDSSSEVKTDETDLCTLIANTLDNAIEALPPDRTIKAEIADDGTTLFFSVSNRYDNKIERAPDGSFISSKADKKNHGLGMKNIQQAVERLNGRITITTDSGIFRVYAEIPLAKQLR